jgi:hypothetical protein
MRIIDNDAAKGRNVFSLNSEPTHPIEEMRIISDHDGLPVHELVREGFVVADGRNAVFHGLLQRLREEVIVGADENDRLASLVDYGLRHQETNQCLATAGVKLYDMVGLRSVSEPRVQDLYLATVQVLDVGFFREAAEYFNRVDDLGLFLGGS